LIRCWGVSSLSDRGRTAFHRYPVDRVPLASEAVGIDSIRVAG
jgi:hypothetical protein